MPDPSPSSFASTPQIPLERLIDRDFQLAELFVAFEGPRSESVHYLSSAWSVRMELRTCFLGGDLLPFDQHIVLATASNAIYFGDIADIAADDLVNRGDAESHDLYTGALGIAYMMEELGIDTLSDQEEAFGARIPWLHMGTIEVPEPLRGRRLSWLLLHHAFHFAGRGALTTLTCGDALVEHWRAAGAPLEAEGIIHHEDGTGTPIDACIWQSAHPFSTDAGDRHDHAVVYNHRAMRQIPNRASVYPSYVAELKALEPEEREIFVPAWEILRYAVVHGATGVPA